MVIPSATMATSEQLLLISTAVTSPDAPPIGREDSLLPPGFIFGSQQVDPNSTTPYSDATNCKKTTAHVKRPMNAFMVWSRMERVNIIENNPERHNAEISMHLGKRWKELTKEQRRPFEEEAERLKALHKIENPDYKYRPQKRKQPATKEEGKVAKSSRGPRRESGAKALHTAKLALGGLTEESSLAKDRACPMESEEELLASQRTPSFSAEVPSPSAAFPATPESSRFCEDGYFQQQQQQQYQQQQEQQQEQQQQYQQQQEQQQQYQQQQEQQQQYHHHQQQPQIPLMAENEFPPIQDLGFPDLESFCKFEIPVEEMPSIPSILSFLGSSLPSLGSALNSVLSESDYTGYDSSFDITALVDTVTLPNDPIRFLDGILDGSVENIV